MPDKKNQLNEFEQLLHSFTPNSGEFNSHQTMFLAGQQAVPNIQTTPGILSHTRFWKRTSGLLAISTTALAACLAILLVTQPTNGLSQNGDQARSSTRPPTVGANPATANSIPPSFDSEAPAQTLLGTNEILIDDSIPIASTFRPNYRTRILVQPTLEENSYAHATDLQTDYLETGYTPPRFSTPLSNVRNHDRDTTF